MRDKRIAVRHGAPCKACKQMIPAGSEAIWRQGYGIRHTECSPDSATPQKTAPERTTHPFDYAEVRDVFNQLVDTGTTKTQLAENLRIHERNLGQWKNDPSWIGCTIRDMRDFIANGYKVAELADLHPDVIPVTPRRRLKFDEDGELQLDLVASGFDYPFLQWQKRVTKPGMVVNVSVDFNSNVSAQVIRDYQTWIARMLTALENEGYDCEVNVSMGLRDSWKGVGENEILIRVKRENEATDFSRWSAMFSPGGFRMLGFTAITMAGDRLGKQVDSGLGSAMSNKWGVSFDPDTRTLKIECEGSREFPSARMTDDLKAALVKATNQKAA
jgi:hypothetical protein